MKKNKLFLDDVRYPENAKNLVPTQHYSLYLKDDWCIVRNYLEFKRWIKFNGIPDLISFDHDLADLHYEVDFRDWGDYSSNDLGVEETGLDCAKWLVNYCLDNGFDLPEYIVHSANPVGRKNIQSYLDNAKKHIF
jgi:hypothetical protein